jgi:hypothetical protein
VVLPHHLIKALQVELVLVMVVLDMQVVAVVELLLLVVMQLLGMVLLVGRVVQTT